MTRYLLEGYNLDIPLIATRPLEITEDLVRLTYEHGIKKKYDAWWCFTGREGKGKSMGLLHAITLYCKFSGKKLDPARIAQNKEQIGVAFGDSGDEDPIGFDEAIEIDSRRSMDDLNVIMGRAAVICRAARNFVQIAVPDPLMVDSRIRRKFEALYYMPMRGVALIWVTRPHVWQAIKGFENTLRPYLLREERRDEDGEIASPALINNPDALDIIPDYTGELRAAYDIRKNENIVKAKADVKRVAGGGEKAIAIDTARSIRESGGSFEQQAEKFKQETGLGRRTYARYLQES